MIKAGKRKRGESERETSRNGDQAINAIGIVPLFVRRFLNSRTACVLSSESERIEHRKTERQRKKKKKERQSLELEPKARYACSSKKLFDAKSETRLRTHTHTHIETRQTRREREE